MPKNKYFKAIIIGDGQVGKSTLYNQLRGSQPDHFYNPIGYFFSLKMEVKDKNIQNSIFKNYPHSGMQSVRQFYQGSSVAVIVYDVSNKKTIENIGVWIQEYQKKNSKRPTSIIIVGNKIDLKKKEIPFFEVDEENKILLNFSEENNIQIPIFEVSAHTGENCDKLLNLIIERCVIED